MRTGLDVLAFDQLKHEHPERYEKADLAATTAAEESPGRWAVKRDGADDAHLVELVEAASHPLGSCSCDGYQYHDGPCSHLAAVWRMEAVGLVDIPNARICAADVEVVGEDRQLSAAVDRATAPEARSDGGVPR